ncbi:hypothetical protein [Vibrio coralliilyticus]|uniref:hypothetical protein n=1 Tax=Vibrio coralliilyticus TaxID=190893 RepID=UPI00117C3B11|nr:hypothetical protein [Vibrio coralliilyticus]NOI60847.1 hypothetical protein [Vibrio coralliilyticus]
MHYKLFISTTQAIVNLNAISYHYRYQLDVYISAIMQANKLLTMLLTGLVSLPSLAEDIEERKSAVKQILKIEDFLPDKKSWTISTGMSITQRESNSFNTYVYQYGLTPSISIPYVTNVSTTEKNTGVNGFASVQYGITKRTSSFALVGGGYREKITTTNGKESKSTSGNLDSYTIGFNYQLDTFQPLNILTASYSKSDYAESPSVGLLSSWIFDPIVLSLSSRYQHIKYDRGDSLNGLAFKGSLSFAVNPEISIRGGLQNKFNFASDQSLLNESEIDLGIGMTLTESVTMTTGVRFSVAGDDSFSSDLRFTFKV